MTTNVLSLGFTEEPLPHSLVGNIPEEGTIRPNSKDWDIFLLERLQICKVVG